jgi:hypothetical protein
LRRFLLVGLALCAAAVAHAAETPDTLYFKNGDRLIGDVKTLTLGEVTIDPPEMDKVNVKWEEIARFTSDRTWNIRTANGRQFRGRFRPSAMSGLMTIEALEDTVQVSMHDVSEFTEMKPGWWDRADGNLSLGYSYQKANDLSQLSFSSRVKYLVGKERLELRLYGITSIQPGVDDVRQDQASLNWMHDVTGRWAVGPTSGYERNSSLNLDSRWRASVMVANRVVLEGRMSDIVLGGYQYNLETSEGEEREEAELFVGNRVQTNFLRKEFQLYADTYANFGLTVKGRTRITIDVTASVEVIDDWTVGVEFYDQYDSKPPHSTESLNDYRTGLTVGWTF